jgi:hypothetical protein
MSVTTLQTRGADFAKMGNSSGNRLFFVLANSFSPAFSGFFLRRLLCVFPRRIFADTAVRR